MHRIKITFNKEFDDIHLKKVSEIGKIKEKNKRINKILNDLDLNEEVPLPTLSYKHMFLIIITLIQNKSVRIVYIKVLLVFHFLSNLRSNRTLCI
jgi:hypothetical protein